MHLHREVIRPRKLRALLELYPSQNRVIAAKLGRVLDLEPDSIFVGNGAVEIIQAILHRFTREKILVNLPTFSPYYEFARPDTQVVFNVLRKEDEFHFDPGAYLELVRRERPDTVVLINPNNPDGGYIPYAVMVELLEELRASRTSSWTRASSTSPARATAIAYWSVADEVRRFPNLMVVKSMSKDFGVAGIRAGYAVMAPERVRTLLDNGYLWNSSGLAEYFFDLYSRPDFQDATSASASGSSATPAGSSPPWPRSRACASIRPTPTSPWWSSRTASAPRTWSGGCSSAAGSTPGPATTSGASSPASSSGSPPATAPRTPTSSAPSAAD